MPNPLDDEALYNSILLGNVLSPGKVTLSGHDRKINWDVKSGSGLAGATTTLKDVPPIQFTALFELLRDESQGIDDFATWPAFQAVIESTVIGSTPKALDIYHPDLASNGIKSVVKAKIGGVVHDGKGGQKISVDFQEYAPPKPKGGTPSGSGFSSSEHAPDPDAAAKQELADLINQFQKTPAG